MNMQLDAKVLQLFPKLNPANASDITEKKRTLQKLACLKTIGDKGPISGSELATKLKVPRSEANKITKELLTLSLIKADKAKTAMFSATTSGLVALNAFAEYQDWTKIKTALASSSKKNDPLAYALLVVGFCANKPDGIYTTLCRYASQGNTMENIAADVSAESLLRYYRQELRSQSPNPPAYLSVFKEFTTAGFQEVFKMLLLTIKPTAEDYNWLVEFFNQVSEFYFDPSRVAFVNLLCGNQKMRQNLEEYKKNQDQQIKKQDGNLEVTFTIPSSGISKIDTMPAHLRTIGMRLILEPAKFINKELIDYFWAN